MKTGYLHQILFFFHEFNILKKIKLINIRTVNEDQKSNLNNENSYQSFNTTHFKKHHISNSPKRRKTMKFCIYQDFF